MHEQTNIEHFPRELSETIRDGLKHGISDEMMVKGMISLGNLFERFIKPDSPEESLIKEIWDEATENEKYTIASIVLRMGKKKIN